MQSKKEFQHHENVETPFLKIGATGFEPATSRPPAVRATKLRHTPQQKSLYQTFRKLQVFFSEISRTYSIILSKGVGKVFHGGIAQFF